MNFEKIGQFIGTVLLLGAETEGGGEGGVFSI